MNLGAQLGPLSITKLSPNWACQMGPIHCPKFLLSGSTLLHSPTSHHPTTRVYSLIIISFLVSPSSLILFEVLLNRSFAYAAPALWNGLPKDLRQFAHPPNRALNFTYPPLARTLLCYFPFTAE